MHRSLDANETGHENILQEGPQPVGKGNRTDNESLFWPSGGKILGTRRTLMPWATLRVADYNKAIIFKGSKNS